MYEGKNIHYSPASDQKPLCSFSGKICNQRRLNHFGFCVRHILEDPTAPFKRCAYVAKSSRQTCTQPIPKNEDREYCNNHMQVLGMLPKKERKPKKEKERQGSLSSQIHLGAKSDPGLLQNKNKPRLSVSGIKSKLISNKLSSGGEDMEDVYAFPTDSTERKVKDLTVMISNVALPTVSVSVTPVNSTSVTKSSVDTGQSSLAKIYPELAEKLEKVKPKIEAKTKGKVKSSRTMNSLQTKIAQNKIKDKLRKNQCSSNTSSQSQSPCHSFTSSPGYQLNSSSPIHQSHSPANSAPPNVTVVQDGTNSVSDLPAALGSSNSMNVAPVPSLKHLNLLNGLNLQTLNMSLEQLGLPVRTVSDIEQTLKQLASAANIPMEDNQVFNNDTGLPSGVPEPPVGTVLQPELQHLLAQTFTPQSKPPPPYSSVHHKPIRDMLHSVPISNVSNTVTQTGQMNKQTIKSDCVTINQSRPVLIPELSSQTSKVPIVKGQFVPDEPLSRDKVIPTSTTALLSSSTSIAAPLSSPVLQFPGQSKLTLLKSSQTTQSVSLKAAESAKQILNLAGFQQPKTKLTKPKGKFRVNQSGSSKRPVPLFSLPMTVVKPRKIPKLLDDEEIKKLKSKSAIEYYNKSKEKRMERHTMICSNVASSDESDLSDCDMLPWQPDWFRASSDEEMAEDEEDSDDGLRTAKLALGRARLRRQCSQARRSSVINESRLQSTSCLISAARESQKLAVECLQEINHDKSKSSDRWKSKGLVKRRCLYLDDNEVQCKHNVVPYTNHCIKHVMYNVDQQLFEYCTAKFADNTQCCHPVIDVKHELPLCMEHGVKADNFLKTQELEPKPKRPRKKTKPSALTRPPKKGKKKRNQRKTVRPEKPMPIDSEDQEAVESEAEETCQPTSEMNIDTDSDKAESQSSNADVNEKPSVHVPKDNQLEVGSTKLSPLVVKDGVKLETSAIKDQRKLSSSIQLEELDNLTSLSELENVKMFGDLDTTASKLLEENDFQEVFSRLPDVAFDIFNSKNSGLPSTDELQDFEESLVLANRELKITKDLNVSSINLPVTSMQPEQTQRLISQDSKIPQGTVQSNQKDSSHIVFQSSYAQTSMAHQPQIAYPQVSNHQQASVAPILEESDDLARQIAEEIMKQNIGPSESIGEALCNGDAEESIKAIARSLSNSGMMLAAETKSKSQSQEVSSSNQSTQSLSRLQSGHLESMYYQPNVAIQSSSLSGSQQGAGLVPTCVISKPPGQIAQSQASIAGQMQSNLVPQNVTVTPQGIITPHLGSARLGPGSQTVTIGNTTVTGNQTAGIITLPVQQQLTAQQLSALVQQATAHLPPLPPYTPRQQSSASSSTVSNSSQTQQSVPVPNPRPLSQEELIQHLAKQQEQLGEQQQLLAQQILQQRLAILTQHPMPMNVTLPSSQNLGFSTILHQGPVAQLGRFNQGVIHAIPNVGQMTQMIKTTVPTSQKTSASVSLPSKNIVWTSPPNVTITSANGLPSSVAPTFNTCVSAKTNKNNKVSPLNDTFIDLTDSNDPPSYEATVSSHGKTQPPPNYQTQTSTNTIVTGKS